MKTNNEKKTNATPKATVVKLAKEVVRGVLRVRTAIRIGRYTY